MIAPKSKISKQRRNLRRSSVWKLETPNLVKCPKCGEYTLSHRACKACGTYKGRTVIVIKDEKAKK
ncbi:MAG: 50S ribosomal protein L32 [Oscillospiraceae bacterium]|jgi:large subunit ribosomal protein L32|nr:50S ribosomal protein L32 [Oscillospiraceae bacterium]